MYKNQMTLPPHIKGVPRPLWRQVSNWSDAVSTRAKFSPGRRLAKALEPFANHVSLTYHSDPQRCFLETVILQKAYIITRPVAT